MARYVPDVHTKRWIVIAPKRLSRPDQYGKKNEESEKKCPFCAGNEKMTPPEVFRLGQGEADAQGWEVRVIPNLYPITDIHEVIIHSEDHAHDFEDLPDEQNKKILTAFKERFNYHRHHGQVLIFTNHGKATGASQVHPHSQLVVIPHQIKLDSLSLEPIQNVIEEDEFFTAYCPEFSQWPYEVWFCPKARGKFFGDATEMEIASLAAHLKKVLNRLRRIKVKYPDDFAYNLIVYPHQDWYLRVIPRLMNRAGFELGTGILLNIVDPCDAAEELSSII